jgi:hypothetical protein
MTLSICITNQGSLIPGPTVSFYSDVDDYTAPIIENVPWSDVLNCPYLLANVPDNTQNIKIVDPSSNCCTVIPVTDLNLCTTCNFTFDSISTTTVGLINAGNLTSTCQGQITDYVIQWYGPDSTTNVAFTTGAGTVFTGQYNQTHPLIGNSQLIAAPGLYIPKIYKVVIDGVTYSQDGSVGTQTGLDCLNYQVTVAALNCNNGTNTNGAYSQYSHEFIYNSTGGGLTQSTLSTTLQIDETINYLAFRFYGGNQYPDTLKIKFYGQLYSEPYIIEYITCGTGALYDLNDDTFPKSWGAPVVKVLNLSNFNRTPNDYLSIEIIPSNESTNTSWELYLKCLTSFDCSSPCTNFMPTIQSSSISSSSLSCGRTQVNLTLNVCDFSNIVSTDAYKYLWGAYSQTANWGGTIIYSPTISLGQNYCANSYINVPSQTCDDSQSFTYIYERQGGSTYIIKSSTEAGRDYYLNLYNNQLSLYFTTTYTPQEIQYYSNIVISVPIGTSDIPCGDQGFSPDYIIIHPPTTTVSNGFDGTYYYISFTRNGTVTNETSFVPCDLYCSQLDFAVGYINNLGFNTNSYSYENSYGSRYQNNIFTNLPNYYVSTNMNPSFIVGLNSMTLEFFKTIVSTEDFIIDQNLSSQICTNLKPANCQDYGVYTYCYDYTFYYYIEPRNPSNSNYPDDFTIKVPPNTFPVTNLDVSTYQVGFQKWDGVYTTLNNYWFT